MFSYLFPKLKLFSFQLWIGLKFLLFLCMWKLFGKILFEGNVLFVSQEGLRNLWEWQNSVPLVTCECLEIPAEAWVEGRLKLDERSGSSCSLLFLWGLVNTLAHCIWFFSSMKYICGRLLNSARPFCPRGEYRTRAGATGTSPKRSPSFQHCVIWGFCRPAAASLYLTAFSRGSQAMCYFALPVSGGGSETFGWCESQRWPWLVWPWSSPRWTVSSSQVAPDHPSPVQPQPNNGEQITV